MAPLTAASTASCHCVICFDEFNLKEQYPVVLPCGHTYVCNVCAQRLDRCMECRESLSFTVPPSPSSLTNYPRTPNRPRTPIAATYRNGRRDGRTPAAAPSSPQHCVTSFSYSTRDFAVRLPLAKNFVLMEMIEAANQRQKEQQQQQQQQVDECNDATMSPMSNRSPSWTQAVPLVQDKEHELELNGILSGMATISGPCGTYTVRERHGLFVLPNHPQIGRNHHDYRPCSREPFAVAQGQTVQVVDFYEDVAKLARDAGYIVATAAQLVKVGQPMDRSCRLEGALETVLNKERKELQRALDKNQQMRSSLQQQLALERTKDPTYPIIADPNLRMKNQPNSTLISSSHRESQWQDVEMDLSTSLSFSKLDDDDDLDSEESPIIKKAKDFSSGCHNLLNKENINNNENRVVEPVLIPNDDTDSRRDIPPNQVEGDREVENNIPTLYRNNSEDDMNLFFGCGAASFFGNNFLNFEEEQNESDLINERDINTISFDSYHGDSSRRRKRRTGDTIENVTSARNHDHRRSNAATTSTSMTTPILSNSFDTLVNFRTGMSGHRALSKAGRKQQHTSSSGAMQSPNGGRNSIRMMSQHQGIGNTIRSPSRYNNNCMSTLLSSPNALRPRNLASSTPGFTTRDDYDFVINATRR